jgi:hypothetical protein
LRTPFRPVEAKVVFIRISARVERGTPRDKPTPFALEPGRCLLPFDSAQQTWPAALRALTLATTPP